MELRILGVAGAALNFGGRRMETIMRVAWLPVILLLVVEMATIFAALSVAAGRLVSFSDVASLKEAREILDQFAAAAWMQRPAQMWIVNLASLFLQALLVASFMAPLVRYAGLGEKPKPGFAKLAFGPDQIRYLLAGAAGFIMPLFIFLPIGATAYFVLKYVLEALNKTYANFPDPDSLHTVELVTGRDLATASGDLWIYETVVPMAAAAPIALILWIVFLAHFHPRNTQGSSQPNFLARALATLVAGGSVTALVWATLATLIPGAETAGGGGGLLVILALGIVAALYVSLRAAPYQGVAVCRKSMGIAGTLRVTRGWNIFRFFIVLLIVPAVIVGMVVLINVFAVQPVFWVINNLYVVADSYAKIVNSGETYLWLLPAFVWIANGILIVLNLFITFFNYGVTAGLLGALYRASEAESAA